eukprot:4774877-Amphidinium_carterae.1
MKSVTTVDWTSIRLVEIVYLETQVTVLLLIRSFGYSQSACANPFCSTMQCADTTAIPPPAFPNGGFHPLQCSSFLVVQGLRSTCNNLLSVDQHSKQYICRVHPHAAATPQWLS